MRSGSLDFLKLVLALMVVAIHSHPLASAPFKMYFFLDNGIARIAVPIFFILNGYFLHLDRDKFISWLKKSVLIYIALTLIYIPFFINATDATTALKQLIKSLIIGNAHLWYFPAMITSAIGLYFIKNDATKIIASVLLFLISCVLQYLSSLGFVDIPVFTYRNAAFAFPFMTIGYLIRNGKIKTPTKTSLLKIALPIAVIAFTVELIINYYVSYSDISIAKGHDIYLSLVIICPIIFLMAMVFNTKYKLRNDHSQNIYFFHMLFILVLFRADVDRGLLCFSVTVLLCMIFSISLKAIKFTGRYKTSP